MIKVTYLVAVVSCVLDAGYAVAEGALVWIAVVVVRGGGRVSVNIPVAASAMRATAATVRKEAMHMAQRSSAAITPRRCLER